MQRLHRDVERNATAAGAAHECGRMISALPMAAILNRPRRLVDRLGEVTRHLAAAEKEISKWREVRRVIEREISERQAALEAARREVDKAARAVAVASVDNVDAIVAQTLANLAALFQLNLLSPGDARIHEFFHGVTLMDQSAVHAPSGGAAASLFPRSAAARRGSGGSTLKTIPPVSTAIGAGRRRDGEALLLAVPSRPRRFVAASGPFLTEVKYRWPTIIDSPAYRTRPRREQVQ